MKKFTANIYIDSLIFELNNTVVNNYVAENPNNFNLQKEARKHSTIVSKKMNGWGQTVGSDLF